MMVFKSRLHEPLQKFYLNLSNQSLLDNCKKYINGILDVSWIIKQMFYEIKSNNNKFKSSNQFYIQQIIAII